MASKEPACRSTVAVASITRRIFEAMMSRVSGTGLLVAKYLLRALSSTSRVLFSLAVSSWFYNYNYSYNDGI